VCPSLGTPHGGDEAHDEGLHWRRTPVADAQGQALLESAKARGANEVGWLEELLEGQLLSLGLQQESSPFVEWC